jgi:hypothetical protein
MNMNGSRGKIIVQTSTLFPHSREDHAVEPPTSSGSAFASDVQRKFQSTDAKFDPKVEQRCFDLSLSLIRHAYQCADHCESLFWLFPIDVQCNHCERAGSIMASGMYSMRCLSIAIDRSMLLTRRQIILQRRFRQVNGRVVTACSLNSFV